MMQQHTITTYSYDELQPKAQEKARDWYRTLVAQDADWSSTTIDDFIRLGEALGFTFKERRKARW